VVSPADRASTSETALASVHRRLCGNRCRADWPIRQPQLHQNRYREMARDVRGSRIPEHSPGRLKQHSTTSSSGAAATGAFASLAANFSLAARPRGRVVWQNWGWGRGGGPRWILDPRPANRGPTIGVWSLRCRAGGRFVGGRGPSGRGAASRSSASRCSFTNHGRGDGAQGVRACAGQDIADARAGSPSVSALRITFLDYESPVQAGSHRRFSPPAIAAARTPIPCVRCNQRIKFSRPSRHRARDLGASALATGHYVRRIMGPEGTPSCTRLAMRHATRVISCSRRHAPSLTICASRWADFAKGETRETGATFSGSASPTSRTARISASSRRGSYVDIVERLPAGGRRARRYCRSDGGGCWVAIGASRHFTVRSEEGARDRRRRTPIRVASRPRGAAAW